jgi:hypothetical protein
MPCLTQRVLCFNFFQPCGVDYELKTFVSPSLEEKPHKRFARCFLHIVLPFVSVQLNFLAIFNGLCCRDSPTCRKARFPLTYFAVTGEKCRHLKNLIPCSFALSAKDLTKFGHFQQLEKWNKFLQWPMNVKKWFLCQFSSPGGGEIVEWKRASSAKACVFKISLLLVLEIVYVWRSGR